MNVFYTNSKENEFADAKLVEFNWDGLHLALAPLIDEMIGKHNPTANMVGMAPPELNWNLLFEQIYSYIWLYNWYANFYVYNLLIPNTIPLTPAKMRNFIDHFSVPEWLHNLAHELARPKIDGTGSLVFKDPRQGTPIYGNLPVIPLFQRLAGYQVDSPTNQAARNQDSLFWLNAPGGIAIIAPIMRPFAGGAGSLESTIADNSDVIGHPVNGRCRIRIDYWHKMTTNWMKDANDKLTKLIKMNESPPISSHPVPIVHQCEITHNDIGAPLPGNIFYWAAANDLNDPGFTSTYGISRTIQIFFDEFPFLVGTLQPSPPNDANNIAAYALWLLNVPAVPRGYIEFLPPNRRQSYEFSARDYYALLTNTRLDVTELYAIVTRLRQMFTTEWYIPRGSSAEAKPIEEYYRNVESADSKRNSNPKPGPKRKPRKRKKKKKGDRNPKPPRGEANPEPQPPAPDDNGDDDE